MSNTLEQLKAFGNALKKGFIPSIILAVIVACITFLFYRADKGIYSTYSKIFPLSINKGGSASPIDAIKSQFGISDKSDLDKMYNVKELVSSRTISRNIVKQIPKHAKYKSYAEWLIAEHNANLTFGSKKKKINATTQQDSFYAAASLLVASTTIEADAKGGFTTIRTSSHEQELCKQLNETILSEISKFYIKFSTEKAQTDLVKIKSLRDSLKSQLYGIENSIAGVQDASRFSVRSSVNIPQARLIRSRIEVEQLYSVAATAYQNANFKLLNESPIFQVLDYPGAPYDFTKTPASKHGVIAGIIAFLLGCLIACRKVFWSLIIEELAKS